MHILRRVRQDNGGFTLVEAMVSLVIIFGLMVVLLRTFDTGTRVIVETRRQAVASALASELIERGQALEWVHMGLATSTRGNSCITEQVGCYIGDPFAAADLSYDALADEYIFGGEKVVFSNADTFRPFLNFYESVQRDTSFYDRYLFVTSIENPVTGDEIARRLTAIVQWVPPSGFRKEVRLETIVSEYQEPSQPFVSGTVQLSGGALRLGPSASGVYPGAYAHGTDWEPWSWGLADRTDTIGDERYWSTDNERQQFDASVNFPAVSVNATSDFVSGASIRVSGTDSSRLQWEGADGIFNTADDDILTVPAAKSEFLTDDDASTIPELQYGATGELFNLPLTAANFVGTPGQGIEITESSDYELDGYLFTEVDPVPMAPPPDDDLPFAQLNSTSKFPAKMSVGFTDYTEEGVRDRLYLPVFGALDAPSYKFSPFRRENPTSASSAIVLGATVDRDDTPVDGYRQITSTLDQYDGGNLYFLDDDAYPDSGGSGDFHGWVIITMPDIAVEAIAGEGVIALPAPLMSTMTIKQWNPTLKKYVVVNPNGTANPVDYLADYGSDCNAGTNVENTLPLWGGAPVTAPTATAGRPYLQYTVSGSVTVRGWCTATTVDGLANRSRTWFETKLPMVSVDLQYQVVDYAYEAAGAGVPQVVSAGPPLETSDYAQDGGRIVLYDLSLHYESEKLAVNAVYIDPSAD